MNSINWHTLGIYGCVNHVFNSICTQWALQFLTKLIKIIRKLWWNYAIEGTQNQYFIVCNSKQEQQTSTP